MEIYVQQAAYYELTGVKDDKVFAGQLAGLISLQQLLNGEVEKVRFERLYIRLKRAVVD
jgi:hypothetical protein